MARTWYIAGPMTGIEDYNYPAFHAAEKLLREEYPEDRVINPATQFDGDQSLPRDVYLRRALCNVAESTDMLLLPGWPYSAGAMMEFQSACALGLRVWFAGEPVSLSEVDA